MLWTDGRILDFALKTVDKGAAQSGGAAEEEPWPEVWSGGSGVCAVGVCVTVWWMVWFDATPAAAGGARDK